MLKAMYLKNKHGDFSFLFVFLRRGFCVQEIRNFKSELQLQSYLLKAVHSINFRPGGTSAIVVMI